jgi:hypothetical protein
MDRPLRYRCQLGRLAGGKGKRNSYIRIRSQEGRGEEDVPERGEERRGIKRFTTAQHCTCSVGVPHNRVMNDSPEPALYIFFSGNRRTTGTAMMMLMVEMQSSSAVRKGRHNCNRWCGKRNARAHAAVWKLNAGGPRQALKRGAICKTRV